MAIVLAALAVAPAGLASQGRPTAPEKAVSPWRMAVSRQYHQRYRPADHIITATATVGRRAGAELASAAARSGLNTAFPPRGQVGSHDLYTIIYGISAISKTENFAVSSNSRGDVHEPISSADKFSGIGASSCAETFVTSQQCVHGTGAATLRAPDIAGELERTGMMVRIGTVLGLAYVGFLFLWFWATRIRPAPERGARV